jgi:hypothetical protein
MADYLPFGVAAPQELGAQEPNVLDKLIAGIINGTVSLPKRVIEATQATAPGLRREDFTDIPGSAQPGADMRAAALDTALVTMGATPFGAPVRAGEVALGAGPVRRAAEPIPIDWTPGGGSKNVKIGNTEIDYGIAKDGKSGEIVLVKTPAQYRGEGSARAAMERLIAEADANKTTMFLNSDPMGKGGLSKSALDKFYQSLGFVKNMGRNKDFTSRAEFVRQPKGE